MRPTSVINYLTKTFTFFNPNITILLTIKLILPDNCCKVHLSLYIDIDYLFIP